jgi:hypothetical protein
VAKVAQIYQIVRVEEDWGAELVHELVLDMSRVSSRFLLIVAHKGCILSAKVPTTSVGCSRARKLCNGVLVQKHCGRYEHRQHYLRKKVVQLPIVIGTVAFAKVRHTL